MRFTSRNTWLGAVLAAALLSALASPGWAQQGTITGVVTGQLDSVPIPGASVLLVNTNRIAVTNRAGRYSFTAVPPGAYDLRVIAVGFSSLVKRFNVATGASVTIDFALMRAVISLDEIVVNPATGEARARESGNQVTNIDMPKALENQTVTNFGDALSGRAAGVQVLQSSGEAGTGTRIRIRGQSSISLSNEPAYYIDGVRVESGDNSLSVGTGGQAPSRVDDINPEDIANVEIIKGPSASTLYGTQAANGVVRITTKHGVAGRARWRVFSEGGVLNDKNQYPTNYYSWGHSTTNPARQCTLFQSAAGSCTIDSLTSFNVLMDPKETFIGTGYRGQGGVQVEGGSDQIQYYVSGDYSDDLGTYRLSNLEYGRLTTSSGGVAPDYQVYRPNELKQTSLRSNMHAQPLTALDFTASLGIVNSRGRLPQNDNNVTGALPSGLFGAGRPGTSSIWGFFLPGDVFQILVQQDITRVTGSFSTNWRPTTFFTGRANVGVDYTGRTDIQFQLRGQGTNFSDFAQGRRSDNRFQIFHYTADVGGTAAFTLAPTVTSKTSVGFQYLKDNFFGVLASGSHLPPGGHAITGAAIRNSSETTTLTVTLGTYLEQTFGWRDRVFLTGGVRNDRNSAFGSKSRSVVYPKVQGSWVISDESFYPRSLPISNLKLRFAYGASGQQPGTTDALLFYSAQTATVFSSSGAGTAVDQPGVDPTAFGNSALKPERSTEFETGFDAGLFHDAARLELTYYKKTTKDALVNRPLPPSNGIATSRFENIGSVRNSGLEAQLSVTKDISPTIGVDAALSIARNVNRLLTLGEGIPPIISGNDQRQVPGYPLFGFWDRPIKSFSDANGNGIIEPNEVVVGDTAEFLGSSFPKTSISLNAGLTLFHNKIRIGGQLDYRGDWKAYNLTERFRCVSIGDNCAAVNVPGSPLDQQARAVAASSSADGFTQAGYIENAAFLKLREANITYYAPESWARMIRATSMQITVTGRNLLKWTSYTGIDPELNQLGQSDLQRDFLTAPPVRTLAVRVSLGF
jgi:TonB-dependent starch-binding outer membrane protein SusC